MLLIFYVEGKIKYRVLRSREIQRDRTSFNLLGEDGVEKGISYGSFSSESL